MTRLPHHALPAFRAPPFVGFKDGHGERRLNFSSHIFPSVPENVSVRNSSTENMDLLSPTGLFLGPCDMLT